MSADQVKPRFVWLLGQGAYQRVYLRFWLMTSGVYAFMLLLQHGAVGIGLVGAESANAILLAVICILSVFYVLMRSGWSQRFADPALTVVQIGFAILMLGVAYVLMPKLCAMQLMITPLGLLFGAFTLSPPKCRQLGWFAVLVQGVATVMTVRLQIGEVNTKVEIIIFMTAAVVYPTTAAMAGRLSAIRNQLRSQKKNLNAALELNLLLARQDELTGLSNRRHALEMLTYEERRSQRKLVPPCVCILDIDHFKRINDSYGHAAGDEVLRLFARYGMSAVRTPDILARWGGEEFILVMPETRLADAVEVIARLHNLLAQPLMWQARPELQVTFSAGVAEHHVAQTIQETVARADAALYQAKLKGRNCTVPA